MDGAKVKKSDSRAQRVKALLSILEANKEAADPSLRSG
jgi:hypothetical protein